MSYNIKYPNINGATESEKLEQIKRYLFQLADDLNWVLNDIQRDQTNENKEGNVKGG